MNRSVGTLLLMVGVVVGIAIGAWSTHRLATRQIDATTLRVERLEVVGEDGVARVVIGATGKAGFVQCRGGEDAETIATIEASDLAARLVASSKTESRSIDAGD